MTTTDNWTTADLVTYIERADPEAYAQVIRVLTERIARDAGSVTDPRSLLLDLGRGVGSLATAVNEIVSVACPEPSAGGADAVVYLTTASRNLEAIADGSI